jgi:hypothetical protein
MTVTFFQDFPVPEIPERGRAVRFVPPPWAGPPANELPALVHIGRFLQRSQTFVMAVEGARVYSTGCKFDLTWTVRRAGESEEEWAEINGAFFGHQQGFRGRRPFNGLLFGVELPDGTRAFSGGADARGVTFGVGMQEPEPPVLSLQGRGGNGADDEMSGSGSLWLWPLPPAGDLRLVSQWKDAGLDESSVILDGGQLRDAAAGAQAFWTEEAGGE